jgi:hypothetical protein
MIKNFFKIKNIFYIKAKLPASILPSSIKLIYLPKIKINEKTTIRNIIFTEFKYECSGKRHAKKEHYQNQCYCFCFKNFQLNYERVFTKTFSLSVSYGMIPEGKLPFSSLLPNDSEVNLEEVELGGSNATLETRFYLGKKGYGHGFYLAPYYRYSTFKVSNFTETIDMETNGVVYDTVDVTFKGNSTAHSAGLLIGAQWFLGKKDNFVLDAWFLGAHYGTSTGDLDGITDRPLTSVEQQQVQDKLDNLDIPVVKYKATVNANGANLKVDGPWAGLRAGISLGYRF